MKFSWNWLSDFLPDLGAVSAEAVSEALNGAGIEIGSVTRQQDDIVLDADITPNRPDAMNHRGLARDLAATSVPLHDPLLLLRENLPGYNPPAGEGASVNEFARVTVEVPDRCHRFAVRAIRNVRPVPAALKLRRRFEAVGLNPINVIVDATNRSLWEIGQPLHAFDADKVAARHLVIRLARAGERLLCLDGVERQLHPEDVVVADEKKALSLAGVMGGMESAISSSTENILLESAWWDPVTIRRTARRHGLHTDASHRYERGADIEAIPAGLALACREILETAGGELAPGVIDVCPHPFRPRSAVLRLARLRALTGVPELPVAMAVQILQSLGFGVEEEMRGEEVFRVTIPSWRLDVNLEEDLIEEVARIYGYERIDSRLPPATSPGSRFAGDLGDDSRVSAREAEDRAADLARATGLFEAVNYSFVPGQAWEKIFGNLLEVENFAIHPFTIANPLDQTRGTLRRLLLPGLIEAASLNFRNGNLSIPLFETGRVWDRDGGEGDTPDFESRHIAFVLAGEAPRFWGEGRRDFDFFDARAVAGRLLTAFPESGDAEAFRTLAAALPAFASGRVARVEQQDGRCLGVFGELAPAVKGEHRLPGVVFAGEFDLAAFCRPRRQLRFNAFSSYPAVDMDLTIAHLPAVTWSALRQAVEEAQLENLCRVAYTARYVSRDGGQIHSTLSLRFRSPERTLSQEEVMAERQKLTALLEKKFGVKV